MVEPVKYVGSDSSLEMGTLAAGGSQAVSGYVTTANDIGLTLPINPSDGIRLTYGGAQITLIPQGGTQGVTAQLAEGGVNYPDFFGKGMSLRYTPLLSGVKEDIIQRSYTGVNTFTFLLNTGGLGLYQENGRYYVASSEDAENPLQLGDLVTFDAHGRFSVGTTTAETLTPNQSYRLTLTVDEDFLTDENTTYPVIIDPTLTVSSASSTIEDVSIYSGAPSTNGNWTYLHAGYYDDTYKVGRILIRLPGLTASSVYTFPNQFKITSAEFHIREATGTAANVVLLYSNAGSATWTESGATWNNSGALLGIQYSAASPAYDMYTTFDITQLVKAWQAGLQDPRAGFILRNSSEGYGEKAFYSSEYSTASYRPYVVVDYEAYSTHPAVNVSTVYDNGYYTRYSQGNAANASNRIEQQMTLLKGIFAAEFGINVSFDTPVCIPSYPDHYCTLSPTEHCSHAENSECSGSVIFSDRTVELGTFHHNEYTNVLLRYPAPDPTSTFRIIYCGHVTCTNSGGFHIENPYYGLTYPTIGFTMITNFTGSAAELKTTVHEFGHIYGAPDHYGGSQLSTQEIIELTGDSRFSQYCIYGEQKDSDGIVDKVTICAGCRAVIESNRNMYNHN